MAYVPGQEYDVSSEAFKRSLAQSVLEAAQRVVPGPKPPGGGGGRGGGGATRTAPSAPGRHYAIGEYTSLTGDPSQGAIPPGEYNVLESLMGEWESLVGYSVEPTTAQLLAMANGGVQTLRDFGQYMAVQPGSQAVSQKMPWAKYGLTKDEYASASATFGTEYKKITGQDISPDALQLAFQNPRYPTGGLLNVSQYAQQLMNDASIQKQFGWVKYGMDFSAWTQQKLSIRGTFGRDINDSEAATILQYHKSTSGANMSAVARAAGQQQEKPSGAGVAQSVAR
jgi:hypothetical protein